MQTQFPNIVILTGAGISAESGLGTFRAGGGLWAEHEVRDVATPEGFVRNPDLVYEFYNARREGVREAMPNPAHLALARLEAAYEGEITLITQNIDDLHERAGSRHLFHMHGEALKASCLACEGVSEWRQDLDRESLCPACGMPGRMRPYIVWFGEMPLYLDEITAALSRADLFLSIGTSGSVYPAAGFIAEIRALGRAHSVELNLEPSEGQSLFAEQIYGKASEIVPDYVERLLSGSKP